MFADQISAKRPSEILSGAVSYLGGLAAAFQWAMEMRRRCDHWERSGKSLDNCAIHQIAEDVDCDMRM